MSALKFMENEKVRFGGKVNFLSKAVLEVVDVLPSKYSSDHLGDQLSRSSTSPALNYG